MGGSSIPNAEIRGKVGIFGSGGGGMDSSSSSSVNGPGPFFPLTIALRDRRSLKLSLKSLNVQSLPYESPGVSTRSEGHIVDGQTKIEDLVSIFFLRIRNWPNGHEA